MRSPHVTVLMPVFNGASVTTDDVAPDSLKNSGNTLLHTAIHSILSQTYTDFELLIIDDGSTDATPEVLARFAAQDNRVRILQKPHQGIVSALNTGLSHARGSLIARMDADDESLPNRLLQQVQYLQDHPETGLVACKVRFGGDRTAGNGAGYARYVDWTNTVLSHDQIATQRFRESPFAHPSVLFRKTLVMPVMAEAMTDDPAFCQACGNGYRQGAFPEDYELWLRMLDNGVRMAKLSEELVVWNDPPARLSRTDERCSVDNFYAMKTSYLAKWLAAHNPHHPDVVVIGAGKMSRRRALLLQTHGINITAWIDVDPKKIGNIVDGIRVKDRTALPPKGQGFALAYLAGHGAAEELEAFLHSLHYTAAKDYLLIS